MIKPFTFFLLTFLTPSNQNNFNPSKFNYCAIKCKSERHTACICTITAPREEVLDDIVEFRQEILDSHNYWRNQVASGTAAKTSPLVPEASDMMGMNYDLELEYIARCFAGRFAGDHDACRKTHGDGNVGQNLAGCGAKDYLGVPELVTMWYNEVKHIEDSKSIDHFGDTKTTSGVIGHFTQLVWSQADLVGCARVWNPEMVPKSWRFTLICNYGSSKGYAGNLVGVPVYKKGPPCSECPFGTKCEDEKFASLCGRILPAPKDDPPGIGGGSAVGKGWKAGNVVFLVLGVFVFLH